MFVQRGQWNLFLVKDLPGCTNVTENPCPGVYRIHTTHDRIELGNVMLLLTVYVPDSFIPFALSI